MKIFRARIKIVRAISALPDVSGFLVFGGFAFLPFVRTGRRLPVQALGERGVLVTKAFLDFGAFSFLPFSLGPPGDCSRRHYVRGESWVP